MWADSGQTGSGTGVFIFRPFVRRVSVLFEIEVLAIKRRSAYEKVSQLGDPILRVLLMTFIFSSILERAIQYGSIVLLCGSGLYIWNGYNNLAKCADNLHQSKSKELNYFKVGYFELYSARYLKEILAFGFSGFFLFTMYLLSHGELLIADGLKVILAFALFLIFCFVWGLFSGLLAARSEVVRKLLDIVNKVLFFASGVFYTAEEIPEELHSVFVWNPLFGINQLLREGLFQEMSPLSGIYTSLSAWILCCAFLGLLLLTQSEGLWRDDRST